MGHYDELEEAMQRVVEYNQSSRGAEYARKQHKVFEEYEKQEELLKKIADAGQEMQPEYPQSNDDVNHPKHYTEHPSGIECIQITEHMNFCVGNALKYLWRSELKNNPIQDLEKALWYIKREIERLEKKLFDQRPRSSYERD